MEDTNPLNFDGAKLLVHCQIYREDPGIRVRSREAQPDPMQEARKGQTGRAGSGNQRLTGPEEDR